MLRYRDICPGFVRGRTGHSGVCSCGLYWKRVMPCHTAGGIRIDDEAYKRIVERFLFYEDLVNPGLQIRELASV